MFHFKQSATGYRQRIWVRIMAHRRTLITYLLALVFVASTAFRGLERYRGLPAQDRFASLLAAFTLLFVIEPWLSRRSHRYTIFYLIVQTGITCAIFLTRPYFDYMVTPFFALSLQALHVFPPGKALRWIGLFTAITAVFMLHAFGWSEGFAFILTHAISYFAIGLFFVLLHQSDATREAAETARQESQRLLAGLQDAHQQLQAYATQAALINQVGQRVSGELELDALLSEIVTAVHDAFDYYSVMLLLLDADGECLTIQSVAGGYADVFTKGLSIPVGEGMTGYAAASGKTQVSGDVSTDPHFVRKEEEETRSELAVPICAASRWGQSGRQVIGVLDIQSDEFDAFDETDLVAMETLSTQIATAIENARLYEAAQRELTERIRAQEALREREDTLKLAIEAANVGFYHLRFTPDETVRLRTWTAGRGDEPDETESTLEDWAQMEGVHPDDRAKWLEAWDRYISGNAPVFEVEHRALTESGEWAWMLQRGQVVARDEHGQPLRIAGMYQDVTARVRAEQALKRRAAQLATLNRIENQVSSILDQQDLLQYVVDAVRDDLGYPRAAVLLVNVDEPQISARLRQRPAKSSVEPLDDRQTRELTVATATEDFWKVIPHNYRQPVGKGAIGMAAATGETVLVRDASSDPRVYQAGAWLSPSSLSTPIEVGGRVIGVLEVEADVADAFDENDIMVMNTLASQVAVAIENVRLYQALRESEETLQLAMEGASVGFWHQNLAIDDQTIIIQDRTQEQGYTEVTDETRTQVVHPDDISMLNQAWDACVSGKAPHIEVEYRHRTESGEWAWILVRGRVVVRDEQGQPLRIAGIYQDVTARVRAQEELREAKAAAEQARRAAERSAQAAEEANRAKSVFLANMSHELRTPLNAILGFAQLMARDTGLTDEQQENLETIGRSGEHLLGLINDVLELSKIEAGRVALHKECFDLHRLLDGLEEIFHHRATGKGLMLIFDRSSDVPQYVRTDEGKLRQVLMNILGNAVKFTREGGVTLRVASACLDLRGGSAFKALPHEKQDSFREGKSRLFFEVEDTGPGIAPEELDAVFDPFAQTKSGQMSQEGTGLGMPISRQFVHLMGGDLTVRSELGVGTLFKFDVQIELADAADVPTSQPKQRVIGLEPDQRAADSGPFRLLIVEDREANRKLLAKLLAPLGFEIQVAVNGQQGIEIWERWKPHLIWMDMRMPVMDGYEATQRIKATTQGQATVIVALTASAFERDRAMILSGGCDDFVRKPFREEEIFDMLAKHLGLRFEYEEDAPPIGVPPDAAEDVLTATSLAALPTDWVAKLHEGATQLDADLILALLDQIRAQHAPLADALESLVHDFRFDTIMALSAAREEGQ